jgi:hypothetical protein
MAFFKETPKGKYEAETISMDYITFSDFLNYSLCVVLYHNWPGPKGPMPHGKGLDNKRIVKIHPLKLKL